MILSNWYLPSSLRLNHAALKESNCWKATDTRQSLLYAGHVFLRNIISDNDCRHLLSLSICLTPLVQSHNESLLHNIHFSHNLIKCFVINNKHPYEKTFTVYNIHHLLHFLSKTLKSWFDVQRGQSYIMGRRCLFSLGWPPF